VFYLIPGVKQNLGGHNFKDVRENETFVGDKHRTGFDITRD
jgi:hypothetical protein